MAKAETSHHPAPSVEIASAVALANERPRQPHAIDALARRDVVLAQDRSQPGVRDRCAAAGGDQRLADDVAAGAAGIGAEREHRPREIALTGAGQRLA